MYKARIVIGAATKNVYRDRLSGAYEGANKVLERCGSPAAYIVVYEKVGSNWNVLDKQTVTPGNLLKC